MAKVPLKGSERVAAPGARPLSPAEATERMEVSVIVRRRGSGEMQSRVAALAAGERSRTTRRSSRLSAASATSSRTRTCAPRVLC